MQDFNCGIDDENNNPVEPSIVIEKTSVESILRTLRSGVGLDIAKNHTGICIWNGKEVITKGFAIDMEYDKNDYMAEAKMRLRFKEQLYEILKDYDFEVCIVEGIYGGPNFDTFCKLHAINAVVDELVLEGKLKIEHLYRFKESEWLSSFRSVIKLGSKLNTKYECQEILRYLEFPFLTENDSLSNSAKEAIFFEDICDATGQLCGLALRLNSDKNVTKSSSVHLSDIKMYFLEDSDDIYNQNDKVIDYFELINPDFDGKDIEGTIKKLIEENSDKVICLYVETKDLGRFGVLNGFKFYPQGFGYLLFYPKSLRKEC